MEAIYHTGAAEAASDLPSVQAARLERARSRQVMIATPVARHPVRHYTLALLDTMLTLERVGIRAGVQWVVGNSNLPRARNELVAEFLASDCTDLIFIDDDMGWQAKDVIRLLASERDFIGGVGRKKTDTAEASPETWCCRFEMGPLEQDDMGAIKVRGIGTGFVKISRKVFEAVAAADTSLKRPGLASMKPSVQACFYSFFRFIDSPDAPMMSEDYAFCESWRRLGGSIWADPCIELVHVGEREFSGTIACLLQAEQSEAA